MTLDGRRLVTNAGLVLVLLGVVFSALVAWFFSGLTFFGEPLTRSDYQQEALGLGTGAVVLLLLLPALHFLPAAPWVLLLAILLAAACGLAALDVLDQAGSASPDEYPEDWWTAPQLFAICPTGWPALAMIVMTPWLRGPSRRARRSPQGRSTAPGRRPSTSR